MTPIARSSGAGSKSDTGRVHRVRRRASRQSRRDDQRTIASAGRRGYQEPATARGYSDGYDRGWTTAATATGTIRCGTVTTARATRATNASTGRGTPTRTITARASGRGTRTAIGRGLGADGGSGSGNRAVGDRRCACDLTGRFSTIRRLDPHVPVSSRGQDTWFSATGPGFESPYRYHSTHLRFACGEPKVRSWRATDTSNALSKLTASRRLDVGASKGLTHIRLTFDSPAANRRFAHGEPLTRLRQPATLSAEHLVMTPYRYAISAVVTRLDRSHYLFPRVVAPTALSE